MKRTVTGWLFLVLLLSLTDSSGQEKNSQRPPNIIFVLTDDLGYGDLGIFFQQMRRKRNEPGEPWHLTPHLDELGRSGARLTQQYCNAPVCAPSRASFLLGVHQGHANVRDNQFDKSLADNHTVGTVLQKAGYATVAVGKWGLQGDDRWEANGSSWPGYPLNRGFDTFFGYVRHVDGHEHYPKEGLYRGNKEVYHDRAEISDDLDKCFTGDLWTAFAKKWIVEHSETHSEKPFFLFLAYDIPHAVLELPTQPYPEGKGLKGGLQWTGEKGHMINTASGEIDSWIHPDYESATYDHDGESTTPEIAWPDTYKRYATVVRRIDDAVGDLRQLLSDLGLDGNTMIVFSSDNGPSLESYLPDQYVSNEPTFFNSFGPFDGIKRDVWEGGVRMPTLVSWPGVIPADKVVDSPSMFSDWLVTFCDMAGVAPPERSDGVSLLPSLTGKGRQRESTIYIEYFNNQKTPAYEEFEAARRGRARNQMQLIRKRDLVGVRYDIQSADDDFEIYNVVTDPKEKSNLAKQYPELQQQMKDEVLRLRISDTSAVRPYDAALVSSGPKGKRTPGLSWKSFKGEFLWVPQPEELRVNAEGKATSLDDALAKAPDNLVLMEGFIKIPEDGEYTFVLKAKGNAIMRIHKALVVDADYGYKSGDEREGTMKLQAGLHPFRICYRKTDDAQFSLSWTGPDTGKQSVPSEVFFR